MQELDDQNERPLNTSKLSNQNMTMLNSELRFIISSLFLCLSYMTDGTDMNDSSGPSYINTWSVLTTVILLLITTLATLLSCRPVESWVNG